MSVLAVTSAGPIFTTDLGEHPHEHHYIVTVPGRGYRFVADVRELPGAGATQLVEHNKAQIIIEEEEEESRGEDARPVKSPAMLRASEERTAASRDAAEASHAGKRHNILTSWWALSLAAVVLMVVAVLGYRLLLRGGTAGARLEIQSLAVLPLEDLSGDPAQEYFADGMTESLISNLARIRALKVISRTSVIRYKGSGKSLPEIARELNVDAVVEGTVQRSGGRVRVTAQLIHAATDAHLWARDYERDLTDVLKLQSEIARAGAGPWQPSGACPLWPRTYGSGPA